MHYIARGCALLLVSVATPDDGADQRTDPTPAEFLQELRRLQERVTTLEHRHEDDSRRITELEEELTRLRGQRTEQGRAAEIAEIKEAIKAELGTPRPATDWFGLGGGGSGGGTLLNPQITVFFDAGGSVSSRGRNNALNRFNLREVELDLRAAVSPRADGVLIIALAEEIEIDRDGDVDIDREVDIEEGYIDFHSLPHDLALKIGKFRNVFGRNNLLHTHDLPQVTRPLAVQSFLGPEGLMTIGASLSWLVPNPWDKYLEATVQVVNADGGTEAPLLGGPNADNPAVVGHVKFFDDLTETSSIEVGASYLFGRTSRGSSFDANVFGLDIAYDWTDPDPGKFRSLLVQGEVFWAHNDVDRGFFDSGRNQSVGGYAFAQYQLKRDWYVGLRADYTEFPNSESRGTSDWDFALSPYVTWYLSEFLRVRLEYQHRLFEIDSSTSSEEVVFLQFTGVFGTHPPHPYWVHR